MAQKNTGTLSLADLRAIKNQSVSAYGVDTINDVIQRDLMVHNAMMLDALGRLCEITTDKQRRYGTSANMQMAEVDEFGKSPSQKVTTGDQVAFPLRNYQITLGWTQRWLDTKTPSEMAEQVIAAQQAHKRHILAAIKSAVFGSVNYDFTDYMVDKLVYPIKRLVNADSAGIPDGPFGEVYDGSTHTHYNHVISTADSATRNAAVTATINDVIEHGHGAGIEVYINAADEDWFAALPSFKPLPFAPVTVGTSSDAIVAPAIDATVTTNRLIGFFKSYPVYTKPWIPGSYMLVTSVTDSGKMLCFRQEGNETLQGLRLAGENSDYPLHTQFMEAMFGVGVYTRTNGAVLHFNADPSIDAYVDPSL